MNISSDWLKCPTDWWTGWWTVGGLKGGEDEEAGEAVAGAALRHHHAVVPGWLHRNFISDFQVQNRRAGRDQETVGAVAQREVLLAALHQLQTHLQGEIIVNLSLKPAGKADGLIQNPETHSGLC